MLTALRAVFGQDEVSHGTGRFRVGLDRVVRVPEAVASHLMHNAGFHVVKTPAANRLKPSSRSLRSDMLVRVHHLTAASCSYGGCEYQGDKNGNFLVPADAVVDLMSHGFVPIPPEDSLKKYSSDFGSGTPTAVRRADAQHRPAAFVAGEPRGPAQ